MFHADIGYCGNLQHTVHLINCTKNEFTILIQQMNNMKIYVYKFDFEIQIQSSWEKMVTVMFV